MSAMNGPLTTAPAAASHTVDSDAREHLIRYGGEFSDLLIERAAGSWLTTEDGGAIVQPPVRCARRWATGTRPLMRAPVLLAYQGPSTAHALNVDLMAHVGAYSDISHLFLRDHLGQHPMPYFDFRFEYPVLTGLFVWVASFAHTSVAAYFLSSTGLLLCLALVTVWGISRIDGANPWLFAAAPALALYGTLNWDLLAICLLVIALLSRGRQDWPRRPALATSAKFFPIVVLPVVVALRLADRRRGSAALVVGVFTATTLAVNLPFALTGAGSIRANWSYFFTYTGERPPRGRSGTPCSAMQRTWCRPAVRRRPGPDRDPGGRGPDPPGRRSAPRIRRRAAVGVRDGQGLQPPVLALDIRRTGDRRGAGGAGAGVRAVGRADLRLYLRTSVSGRPHRLGLPAGGPMGCLRAAQLLTAWLALWMIRRELNPNAVGLGLQRLRSPTPADDVRPEPPTAGPSAAGESRSGPVDRSARRRSARRNRARQGAGWASRGAGPRLARCSLAGAGPGHRPLHGSPVLDSARLPGR